VLNNPVFFIDPDGMEATPPDEYVFNRNGTRKRLKKPGLITKNRQSSEWIQFMINQ
jgi:hypothetical protein